MLTAVVVVVSSGALVRATNSGAGCGESWPRCDQQLFPIPDSIEQLIEFTHRMLTSGLVIGGIALIVLSYVQLGKSHPVTRAAVIAFGFLLFESVLGAALVLFGWVEQDASIGRLVAVPIHLMNTFALIAAYALVAWRAAGRADFSISNAGHRGRVLVVGAGILVLIAAIGSLNALADTLFPAESIVSAITEEFGSTAPILLKIRVLHPIVAIGGSIGIVFIIRYLDVGMSRSTRKRGWMIMGIIGLQFVVGLVNIALLTPVEIQVFHLVIADLLWIAYLFYMFAATTRRVADNVIEVPV
ncbi:Cell division protein FtsW [hydrothermal vent metagenome]|uniref:Cell division protein FtsW n=1 Tax=hydrothermal vent metagenome TaxID=652676 RepID=A0A3B0SA32_9ZZZZ